MDLAEFAEKNPSRTSGGCWVCQLPERKEIDKGLKAGNFPSLIARWLKTLGYTEATEGRVRYHRDQEGIPAPGKKKGS